MCELVLAARQFLCRRLKAEISLSAIALAISVSGSIGLFFGVIPARQAARLDPIVALRSN
ncbi:MAG: hypothetical protein WA828_17290 [Coleofasciculaceae cyanobacterium]